MSTIKSSPRTGYAGSSVGNKPNVFVLGYMVPVAKSLDMTLTDTDTYVYMDMYVYAYMYKYKVNDLLIFLYNIICLFKKTF